MILDYFDTQIGTVLACGNQIRQALVVACSEAEQDTTGAKATRLKALLDEASTYLATLDDVTAPTVSSRTQACVWKVPMLRRMRSSFDAMIMRSPGTTEPRKRARSTPPKPKIWPGSMGML